LRFLTDERLQREALKRTLRKLGPSHEFKHVEDSFFAAAAIYIGQHLSTQEKDALVKEIIDIFERELAELQS
jgi:hypothetical protein